MNTMEKETEEINLDKDDWEEAKRTAEEQIKQGLRVIEFNKALLQLAKNKLKNLQ